MLVKNFKLALLSVLLCNTITNTFGNDAAQTEKDNVLDPRIVGGVPADLISTGHQVSLRLRARDNPFGSGHTCGGSLISNNTVLTAAHCVFDSGRLRQASDFVVVGGTLNRRVQTSDTIVRYVTRVVVHNKYYDDGWVNDIALLTLSETVPANHPIVKPIQLASREVMEGTNCTITGWGTTVYDKPETATSVLLTTNVLVVSNANCRKSYGNLLSKGMLCAGVPQGGKDACQGDSGGPFVCNGVLTGVVSFGNGCGSASYPGVYSDVYYFRDWVARGASDKIYLNSFVALIMILLSGFTKI